MSNAEAGPSRLRGTVTPLFPSPSVASPNRPSLFDLLAEDQLRDLLHPVVHYVLTVSQFQSSSAEGYEHR